jgi:hypothetical protein
MKQVFQLKNAKVKDVQWFHLFCGSVLLQCCKQPKLPAKTILFWCRQLNKIYTLIL